MDHKKILLENERSTHLTKRLNRLSSWGFFKVLYRTGFIRMIGLNFLILFCLAPMVLVLVMSVIETSSLQAALPYFSGILTGTGVWREVATYYSDAVLANNIDTALWCIVAAIPIALVFSGAYAVIRDSFWVGEIKVLKRFAMGVSSNIGYAILAAIISAGAICGTYIFAIWSPLALTGWVSVVLTIVLAIVALLVTIFALILCSVTVTYKQSFAQNIKDSWNLLWLNIVPNIFHFVVMVLPIAAFVLLGASMYSLVLTFFIIIGGFYFAFTWQTHMMKTFALFHPVAVNKKGETKQNNPEQQPQKG